jgi:hypothetical protein
MSRRASEAVIQAAGFQQRYVVCSLALAVSFPVVIGVGCCVVLVGARVPASLFATHCQLVSAHMASASSPPPPNGHGPAADDNNNNNNNNNNTDGIHVAHGPWPRRPRQPRRNAEPAWVQTSGNLAKQRTQSFEECTLWAMIYTALQTRTAACSHSGSLSLPTPMASMPSLEIAAWTRMSKKAGQLTMTLSLSWDVVAG